jgi:succinate dehydrogenase / fumarate reductase cytochrome b subunit
MRYGGVIIALFVVWHLLDLTFGAVNPAGGTATPYDKVVSDFDASRWYITLFYLVAVVMVGLHLRHGLWSAFQSLGLAGRRRDRSLRLLAVTVSVLLVIGFAAVPIAVSVGLVN